MNCELTRNCRDVGLAETRYVNSETSEYRRELAKYMREIAGLNESSWILPGYEEIDKKRMTLRRQADRLEVCGHEYTVLRCSGCKRAIVGPRRCECRVCPDCARKYAACVRSRQQELFKTIRITKTHRFAFLTLTKKTYRGYRPTSKQARTVHKHVRKLLNTLWPKRSGCGAFSVLEVGKDWNLHVHILLYGHYVPQSQISSLWEELTGDSKIVDIRTVRKTRTALNYLLKYVTKPPNSEDPKETAYYVDLLIGLRRIHTFGIFYGRRLATRPSCPCPLCGGKLKLSRFDPGPIVPENALFFAEALQMAALVGQAIN